jgi:CheY-like chemotaxis protein
MTPKKPESAPKPKQMPLINGRPVKILVIDDDAFISGIYVLALGRAGCDIQVVRSGKEGLVAAKANPPDIILLDLMMPEMDGFETLERIRKDTKIKDIPVLILSSLTQKEDTERVLSLGAAGFLKKTETLPKDCLSRVKETLKI